MNPTFLDNLGYNKIASVRLKNSWKTEDYRKKGADDPCLVTQDRWSKLMIN